MHSIAFGVERRTAGASARLAGNGLRGSFVSKNCIVISGRLPGDKEDVAVWQPIAEAFKLDASTFAERVLPRMPLIVRQDLDQTSAETLAAQLRASSVDAVAVPQDAKLALIERDGHTKGPLPFGSLGDFIRDGERYRFRDSNEWITWGEQAPTFELPPLDGIEVPPSVPIVPSAVNTPVASPEVRSAVGDMPPDLPAQSVTGSSLQGAAISVDAADNLAAPPPLPLLASRNEPRAIPEKKGNTFVRVFGVIACLFVAWLALKGLSTSLDSDASSLGAASSGPSNHLDSSDLHKIASGHFYLIEYKVNGESNSWISDSDKKLTNIVYQVGNGFIQKCFMEQGEKTPSNCAPPMIEMGNGGSVHSTCVGGTGRSAAETEAIWACVSDAAVQGDPYGSEDGDSTIAAGVPYIETSSGNLIRRMRFRVADSEIAPQLPAATGRGGK